MIHNYRCLREAQTRKERWASIAALCLLFTITSCGEDANGPANDVEEEVVPQGQVIARLNGQEITVHELSAELARVNLAPNADREAAERRVLQALAERTLYEQKAVENQMERLPSVFLNLRRARSAILAQSYVSQVVANIADIDRRDAEAFVRENPYLFADREYFIFDNIVTRSEDILPEMQDALEALGNIDAVEARLRQLGIEHRRQPRSTFSESLATIMLDRMDELEKDNRIFFVISGARTFISRLQSRRPAVLTGENAYNAAIRILRNRATQQSLQELKAKTIQGAELEFLGKYADLTMEVGAAIDTETAEQIDEAVRALGDTEEEAGEVQEEDQPSQE